MKLLVKYSIISLIKILFIFVSFFVFQSSIVTISASAANSGFDPYNPIFETLVQDEIECSSWVEVGPRRVLSKSEAGSECEVLLSATNEAAKGGKYAFGLKNVVPKFADDIGAVHLMKDPNWKSSFMKAINNPSNELHFNLNGIDSKPMQMILAPGRSGINGEMNALYQNSAAFERTMFYYGGNTYKGFEVFKIIP